MSVKEEAGAAGKLIGQGIVALLLALFFDSVTGARGPFEGVLLAKVFYWISFGVIAIGVVQVVVTLKSHATCPQCKEDVKRGALRCAHCGAALNHAGANSIGAPTAASTPGAPAARLQELQALRDQGLISPEEYETKKVAILQDL